jgi:2-C-methyl-D-erythritol 4-phosphate cytidylyltransferase
MGGVDKMFAPLSGKAVLLYSLLAFQRAGSVDEIIVAARPESAGAVEALCRENGVSKLKAVVAGGETRAQSVLNAVAAIEEEDGIIAVHDGARPLVTPRLADAAVEGAREHKAVILAVAARDTVKAVAGGFVTDTPNRENMFLAQTPQAFDLRLYRRAALDARFSANATDDGAIMERAGVKVKTLEGDYGNIKITSPEDFTAARALLAERSRYASD